MTAARTAGAAAVCKDCWQRLNKLKNKEIVRFANLVLKALTVYSMFLRTLIT